MRGEVARWGAVINRRTSSRSKSRPYLTSIRMLRGPAQAGAVAVGRSSDCDSFACPRFSDFMIRSDRSSDPMMGHLILIPLLTLIAAANAASAFAQYKAHVNPKPLPPLANSNDPNIGAKELFGRKVLPAAMPTRVLGFYAHGCIAGAEGLPINGDNWQVMRLSRNRYWGHPNMVALVKRLAAKARKDAGWPGILVGDMSQPRGGPMFTGHASHQVGLDADIWLTPMPTQAIVAQRARGDVGGDDGARRPARHRSERLDADAISR